jgi:hypothetical protein
MRFVLGLTNPEQTHYAKTDYRAFIQALFTAEGTLRDDIALLSFNYDPYLEFALLRAFTTRTTMKKPNNATASRPLAITGGFWNPDERSWLDQDGFCHLKLHGTSAPPNTAPTRDLHHPPRPGEPTTLTTDHLFRFGVVPRMLFLIDHAKTIPPVLLPWEIVREDGQMLAGDEHEKVIGPDWPHHNLYPLFQSVWIRAQEEIRCAHKISFVGLSLGAFLEPELVFLFQGRRGQAEVVVANPDNTRFQKLGLLSHPRSPTERVKQLLKKIAPECEFCSSDVKGVVIPWEIRARDDFRDFIEWEMQ